MRLNAASTQQHPHDQAHRKKAGAIKVGRRTKNLCQNDGGNASTPLGFRFDTSPKTAVLSFSFATQPQLRALVESSTTMIQKNVVARDFGSVSFFFFEIDDSD
jgi:hypothetical protein